MSNQLTRKPQVGREENVGRNNRNNILHISGYRRGSNNSMPNASAGTQCRRYAVVMDGLDDDVCSPVNYLSPCLCAIIPFVGYGFHLWGDWETNGEKEKGTIKWESLAEAYLSEP